MSGTDYRRLVLTQHFQSGRLVFTSKAERVGEGKKSHSTKHRHRSVIVTSRQVHNLSTVEPCDRYYALLRHIQNARRYMASAKIEPTFDLPKRMGTCHYRDEASSPRAHP
jgi:hypothetical protein